MIKQLSAISYQLSAGQAGDCQAHGLRPVGCPPDAAGGLEGYGCLPASPRPRVFASGIPSPSPRRPVAPSPRRLSSLAPRFWPAASCRAFSLIEMVVVVAIIGLLLAIAVPVSVALVKSNQSKLTTITLETVKNAIDTFQNRKPLRNLNVAFEADGGYYWDIFGPLPPSPTAQLSYRVSPSAILMPSNPSDPRPLPVMGMEATTKKFAGITTTNGIIPQYTGGFYAWRRLNGTTGSITAPDAFWADAPAMQYPTIECLVFFLRNYSPEAKAIIDKLGKALTNEDFDFVVTGFTVNDRKIDDLYEVRDAWKNAIQYNVQAVRVPGGRQLVWELRSAGPDGKFVDVNGDGFPDPFAPVEAGDDVVVSGMLKVEDNN